MDEEFENNGNDKINDSDDMSSAEEKSSAEIDAGSDEETTAEPEHDEEGNHSSISADLIRGHINTIILRALYERDKYGYEIMNDIEAKSHGQYTLKQPTLYSALKRLETQGYIKAYWKKDDVTAGGRRKYFTLTDIGKEMTEKNLAVEKKTAEPAGPSAEATGEEAAAVATETAGMENISPKPQPPPIESSLAESSAQGLLDQASVYLNHLRERFEKLPLVQFGLDQISRIMQDESAQRELAGILLRRTGGLVSFTASVLGMIVAILVDLLMTVFFFLLFLSKLAEFCGDGGSDGRQSEYLVRTVFNGSWLPGASEETVAEAQRIISGVIVTITDASTGDVLPSP